jgi:hypothetical protein
VVVLAGLVRPFRAASPVTGRGQMRSRGLGWGLGRGRGTAGLPPPGQYFPFPPDPLAARRFRWQLKILEIIGYTDGCVCPSAQKSPRSQNAPRRFRLARYCRVRCYRCEVCDGRDGLTAGRATRQPLSGVQIPTMISEEPTGVADGLMGRERRRVAGCWDRTERHCLQDRGTAG